MDLQLCKQVAIENTAPEATRQQRLQLWQGVRSDGSEMPHYSFRSVFQYGKPEGPIKLYDTGDFYKGVLIDVRGDIFIMESADGKSTMLQNRYGKEILGLGETAQTNYIRVLRPEFIRQAKAYLE